jgi:hypothetical protein
MEKGIGRALARGTLASVAGLVAMDLFTRAMKNVGSGSEQRGGSREGERGMDDISLVGRRAKEGEPATVAVGRIAYEKLRGEEPSRERGAQLGWTVHWGYGLAVGGLFGLLERRLPVDGLSAGLGYGAALWLLGDELAVPMLGLSKGPTAHPPRVHAQALGAHLVYGLATGAALSALERRL